MRVGRELRRLREAAGLTQTQAGDAIRGTGAKISRMESAVVGARERDVADLLTHYGVTDEAQRDALLTLVRESRKPGWWHVYREALLPRFDVYVGLEEAATKIRAYEPQFVPGLLQTEDYGRAVTLAHLPEPTPAEAEQRVEVRLARQRVLAREEPPELHVLIEESVLRRRVGGGAVMRAQLDRLLNLEPNVRLQVMPVDSAAHPAMYGVFHLFDIPELPRIAYCENMTSAIYLEEEDDVSPYSRAFDRACSQAASPDRSLAIIKSLHRKA